MKITWEQTGDDLDIDLYYPDLMEYWKSNIFDEENNEHSLGVCEYSDKIIKNADLLLESVNRINELFLEVFQLDAFNFKEFILDQRFLNKLHATWKVVQLNNPVIIPYLESLGGDWIETFYNINTVFHTFESKFCVHYSKVTLRNKKTEQIETPEHILKNIHNYTKNGIFQVYFDYRSLGRSDFDAWNYSDNIDLSCAVINNYTSLPYGLTFLLHRPYVTPYPEKYITEMKENGRKHIVGDIIPVGNFIGYEDSVKDLYDIFYRNITKDQKMIIGEI